jgi:hypothetical protein
MSSGRGAKTARGIGKCRLNNHEVKHFVINYHWTDTLTITADIKCTHNFKRENGMEVQILLTQQRWECSSVKVRLNVTIVSVYWVVQDTVWRR